MIDFSPEEFERRIDSELAALDALPFEEHKLQRYSVISEDLLEFSDNLIDCDSSESDPAIGKNLVQDSAEESLISFPSSSPEKSESSSKDSSTSAPSSSTASSVDRPPETGWQVGIQPGVCSVQSVGASRAGKPSHIPQDSNLLALPDLPDTEFASGDFASLGNSVNSHRKVSQRSSSSSSSVTRCSDLSRQSDHVSCEDLLEFACDGPNVRRTRGPRNGEQSDEVRIMMKVLHEQSTPESCVEALNVTDWDVLAAIKLERLQGLLRKENNFVGLEDCKVMLGQCGGDVVKAAALLRNTEDTAAV